MNKIKRFIRLELDQTQSEVVRTDGGGVCESGRPERDGHGSCKDKIDLGSF